MSVTVNGTSGLVFGDGTIQGTAAGMPFRNKIINGDMRIDQRNVGAIVTAANAFTVDRFVALASVASKYTTQQNAANVTPPVGFKKYLGITSSSAYTVGATERFVIQQVIEGNNCSDFEWGTSNAATVTLSFWVRSSLTGMFGGALMNSVGELSYPFSYTISSANTWEKKSITIAGPTTGAWATDNTGGVVLRFSLGTGASASSSAGSWTSGEKSSTTGAVSVVGTNLATFYITGVQLEKAGAATTFEYRPIGTELALCQRYFYMFGPSPSAGTAEGRTLVNPIYGNTARLLLPNVPEMRSAPAITFYNSANSTGALTEFSAQTTVTVSSANNISTIGGGYAQLTASVGNGVHFKATYSAEL